MYNNACANPALTTYMQIHNDVHILIAQDGLLKKNWKPTQKI